MSLCQQSVNPGIPFQYVTWIYSCKNGVEVAASPPASKFTGSQNGDKKTGDLFASGLLPSPLSAQPSTPMVFSPGGLSVQPAAVENKNGEMEEIWESKLPARRGLLTTACHRPINLSESPAFLGEIGVSVESGEPFSLLA